MRSAIYFAILLTGVAQAQLPDLRATAQNAGQTVGNAAKTAGEKVGNAAQQAGSEIKGFFGFGEKKPESPSKSPASNSTSSSNSTVKANSSSPANSTTSANATTVTVNADSKGKFIFKSNLIFIKSNNSKFFN
jgi:hypothetical protein